MTGWVPRDYLSWIISTKNVTGLVLHVFSILGSVGLQSEDLQQSLFYETFDRKLYLAPIDKEKLDRVLDTATETGFWAIDFGMLGSYCQRKHQLMSKSTVIQNLRLSARNWAVSDQNSGLIQYTVRGLKCKPSHAVAENMLTSMYWLYMEGSLCNGAFDLFF